MGVITRSEAAYRLKIASSKVNNAVADARDGKWVAAHEAATDAVRALETLIPHLLEASKETVGSLSHGVPPETPRTGGLGYRGSVHHTESWTSNLGNKTKADAKPRPAPEPIKIRKPIIVPPPPRGPIEMGPITPPPPAAPECTCRPGTPDPNCPIDVHRKPLDPNAPSIFPPEFAAAEIVVFDVEKIRGDRSSLTPEEARAARVFDGLLPELKAKIVEHHEKTGRPVRTKIREKEARP